MGKWFRCDANAGNHPKFVRAGFYGAALVRVCWEIAKEFDCVDGDITKFWNLEYLGARTRLEREENGLELVATAMLKAVESGLILEKDGRFFIHDWNEYQYDSGAVRIKRYREKKKREGVTRCNITVTNVTQDNDNDNDTDNDSTMTLTSKTIKSSCPTSKEKISKEYPLAVHELSDALRAAILSWKPNHRISSNSCYQDSKEEWMLTIDRMLRLDKRTPEAIRGVITWLPSDSFWPQNVQGATKLRKHFDRLEHESKKHEKKRDPTYQGVTREQADQRARESGWKT